MDDNDNLGYISSVDTFAPEKSDPSVDAPDEKALERLMRVVENEFKLYHTLSGVKRFDKSLSLEQRFELCDHYTMLLSSLSQLLSNAIEGIKDKQINGR